ncbi:hypothetical protein J6590_093563, partial [Homalodisca vitripennis]
YKEKRNPLPIDGEKTSRRAFRKFLYRTFHCPANYKRRLRLCANHKSSTKSRVSNLQEPPICPQVLTAADAHAHRYL